MIELGLGPARVIWTDRHGGTSAPPFGSANLAHGNGDDPANVDANRARVAERLGLGSPGQWQWLRQVHGATVVDAERATTALLPVPDADACVTHEHDLPLVVLTADCAPVALACDDAVAVAHAGWPGLLGGVLEATVERLRAVGRGPVLAALGPCVHPDRYEFGAEHLARIVERLGPRVAAKTATGTPALDIPQAVRAALARVGVDDLTDVDVCTSASPDHFSHRRDGPTGRQGLIALLST